LKKRDVELTQVRKGTLSAEEQIETKSKILIYC
jgi:hypothetical protein